jgi:type VII secretion-associated serine protease mycosin
MSRIAAVMLGVALVAAVPAPAAAAARSAAQSPGAAAAKPSPKPSPGRSPSPPARPSRPAPPSVPTPVPAEPRPNQQCPGLGSLRVTTEPWAQQALDFSSAWPLTQGQGVTVAVVDSGVDYSPQLAGKVTAFDLTGTGPRDCSSAGHGTSMAGIIAATDMQARGVPFEGVAPEARILSVKYTNTDQGNFAVLAQGIRDAALQRALVINVSTTVNRNTPELQSAVAFALRRGAVIVAAGGNDSTQTGAGPFYPASYPGVLSVGAVASDGSLAPFSDLRSRVAVTAPGVNVTSTCPGGYCQNNLSGTSYATAFVSGVAALVRARYPAMTAAQVVRRIEETANGGSGPGTGDGLVNPLQAVTAILPARSAHSPLPTLRPQPVSVQRAPPPNRAARTAALEVVAGALTMAALVALGAVVISQGRRRRWRAGSSQIPADGRTPSDHRP